MMNSTLLFAASIATQQFTIYAILGFIILLIVGTVIAIIKTRQHDKKYDGAALPDLDFGFDDDEEETVEEAEESAFTLEYDQAEAEASRSEADAMFNAVVQQSTRRQRRSEEKERSGLFKRFKK